MKLLDSAKELLLEYIPKNAVPYDSEFYLTIDIHWFISQHALGRMTRTANVNPLTLEEIEDMCDRATEPIIRIAYNKMNSYVFRPGFEFQVRDTTNYYASLGCIVDYHKNLDRMNIVIKTTVKSGSSLKYKGEFSGQQLVIDI